eukprot:1430203-Pyramimonas_sp.AAC.1
MLLRCSGLRARAICLWIARPASTSTVCHGPSSAHAGVAQFCRAFSQQCTVHKVKAHLDVDGAEDSWGRDLRDGNHAFDLSAKKAILSHPQPDLEQVEDLERSLAVARA